MAAEKRWFFTKEQLENTPSRRCGYDAEKELSCRQQAANLIQDMGHRLHVNQLCINTAMVYMHRFFVFHSFTQFHRNAMATAALFLAAKVEEQPRKLEYVIKVSQLCLTKNHAQIDVRSEEYLQQAADLVMNENILLQTLGFDVGIDHPHTHIVRCCHVVHASKDLAQTSYFMATNSLHLTTMCLQYKATVVACFCIHLACKWSNWEIPQSNEGKPWFWYVDKTVTIELLEQLTSEFLFIFDKCPSRLKKRIYQQNSQNSLSSQNFSLDMDASRRNLSNTNSGVSFQQPISTADQLQAGPSSLDKKREHSNISNLRQSYGQLASTSHKKTTHGTHKESIASHPNVLKHPEQPPSQQLSQQHTQQQLPHQHQPQPQQQQPQHHHSASRLSSIPSNKVKVETQRVNSMPSLEGDQFGSKQIKPPHVPTGMSGYLRNGTTLPQDHDLIRPDYVKKEAVNDSHYNGKRESGSNSHYQKHNSSLLNSQTSDSVISSVLKEVTSSSSTSESSLSQSSVQIKQEVKQERLSPVQTSSQKTHSIFSPELRSPPPKFESKLSLPIKTELESAPSDFAKKEPVTPTTPTNSHKKTPIAVTPELVPVVPRLENLSGYKNIIEKSKISVTISNSNDVVNSTTYVPTNNSASITYSNHSDARLDPEIAGEKSSSNVSNVQNQHFSKTEPSSNNTVPILSISSHERHKKKKKNKEKDRDKSKHREHRSEHKKHHKKHKEKDKRRDKEKDVPLSVPKIRIINDPAPIKITIPKDKLKEVPATSGLKLKLSTHSSSEDREREKDKDRSNHDPNSLKIKISRDVLQKNNSSSSRKRDRSYDSYNSSSSAPPSKKYFHE